MIARFGGDEFLALIGSVRGEQDVLAVAETLLGALNEPFMVDGHELFTSTSIGIALSWQGSERADRLLRHAATALQRAKEAGGGRVVIFHSEESTGRHDRLALESDLWHAVEHNELLLHYQPAVHLQSSTITGMEALRDAGLPPSALKLEITEGALMA